MHISKSLLVVVVLVWCFPVGARAEDRIQAFTDSNGKVVFTNMIDDPVPAVPVVSDPSPEFGSTRVGSPVSLIQLLIDSISKNHGVDPQLVTAMMKTESNFNRWAVSSKGALGLMQLIPETGRRFGVRDFFDPRQNIEGGVRYLKFLLQKFNGNIELSLAAYNAGENVVARFGRVPPIQETQDYVRKIRAIYKQSSAAAAKENAPKLEASAAPAPTETAPMPPVIYKTVDERGIVHFSNVDR
jgi:soluble lytic murein transglycosylase-like protein